jgi:hypothetical protein
MERLIFGIAFGQLLFAAVVVALQLLVTVACWYLAETAWQSCVRGFASVVSRVLFALRARSMAR